MPDRKGLQTIKDEAKEAMRLELLDIASELLEKEGPQALSMRRISVQAGCSTMMLYTLFKGKEGLAEGLYSEGFRRLQEALDAVNEEDNLERLKELNRTYRRVALSNPSYYSVMFERPIVEFRPSKSSRLLAWQSLQNLISTIQTCINQQLFKDNNAEMMAMELWTLAHGLVSVELSGYLSEKPDLAHAMHEKALNDMIKAWSK